MAAQESVKMRAMLWESLEDEDVRCRLCAHACRLKKGGKGLCGVRVNSGGELVSMVTDVATSVQMDPVEKKPLYHFLPGSRTFSVGSAGCNFQCRFCQNHQTARVPSSGVVSGRRVTPDALVRLAENQHARSMAFTYNEPTVFFELLYETAGLAQAVGLRVILVSNGFMGGDFLLSLRSRVNAINVDLKSFSDDFYREYCGGRLQPVLDNLRAIRGMDWWLEVTTPVIPGCNDSTAELRDMAAFVHDELGPDTPWHLSAFHGACRMAGHPSTPLPVLEKAWSIGREAGLHFVYIGNASSAVGGTTFCPTCGAPVIERRGWRTRRLGTAGQCPSCKATLPGVWK